MEGEKRNYECMCFAGDAIIIVNFTAIKKGREIRDVSFTAAAVHRDSPGENVQSAKYINVIADSEGAYVAAAPSFTFSTNRASKFNNGIFSQFLLGYEKRNYSYVF